MLTELVLTENIIASHEAENERGSHGIEAWAAQRHLYGAPVVSYQLQEFSYIPHLLVVYEASKVHMASIELPFGVIVDSCVDSILELFVNSNQDDVWGSCFYDLLSRCAMYYRLQIHRRVAATGKIAKRFVHHGVRHKEHSRRLRHAYLSSA